MARFWLGAAIGSVIGFGICLALVHWAAPYLFNCLL